MAIAIIVCVKIVPDTGARVEIEDGLCIKEDASWIINPYDEFAIEEAIKIKERLGARVTLLHVGSGRGLDAVKKGVAMGADSAICVKDESIPSLGSVNIAKILSLAIASMPYDAVFCGKEGFGSNEGVIGGAVAGFLGLPFIPAIKRLQISPDMKTAEALVQGDTAVYVVETRLPAIFSADKGLNEPRYPSLAGIMKAKKTELQYLSPASLGLKAQDLIRDAVKRVSLSYPQKTRRGLRLTGDIEGQVREAVRFLKDEVKVI